MMMLMDRKTDAPHPEAGAAGPARHPEAGLLLGRLEERILKGERLDQVLRVLQKETAFRHLSIKDRLRWSELAQMIEAPHIARKVLHSLNREHPDCAAAWEKHLELLSIVGPADAFASLLARARSHIGEAHHADWLKRTEPTGRLEEKEIGTFAAPLERYRQRLEVLRHFMSLFAGREDCFARQWADRKTGKQGYVPERRPMGLPDLDDHLAGRKTYGIYLLQADGNIRTAVIDADLNKSLRGGIPDGPTRHLIRREATHLIARLTELSKAAGITPLVEFSGAKGYHFWYFFSATAASSAVRAFLHQLVQQVQPDLTAFGLEVFPKQDQPGGKGFGNLVKLPLGLHRSTGKRSFFPACSDRSVEAQLNFLAAMRAVDPVALLQNAEPSAGAEIVVHPRWRNWADEYPALYRLQRACAPLAQAMSFCLEGGRLSLREEKVLYQTIGFLDDGGRLLHHLMANLPDYNPHLVDYRLSRLRGTPLGCRRIHALLDCTVPLCRFDRSADYLHPLLHLDEWREQAAAPAEKVIDLSSALARLQTAIRQVERFLK
jgi:hypothetical protein